MIFGEVGLASLNQPSWLYQIKEGCHAEALEARRAKANARRCAKGFLFPN